MITNEGQGVVSKQEDVRIQTKNINFSLLVDYKCETKLRVEGETVDLSLLVGQG